MRIFFIFLIISHFTLGFDTPQEAENHLYALLEKLRESKNNTEKEENNRNLKKAFLKIVEDEEFLSYQFTKLKTIGIIDSPDKAVRIINWNIEQDDESQKYECIVLHKDKKKKRYYVKALSETPFGNQRPEDYLTDDQWYGALYYQIIPIQKGSRTMYTLLGWDQVSLMSQMKFIDVMYFSGSTVKFGSPIFKVGKISHKRIFFEHSKKVTMYLKYEKQYDRIIFDHLAPESPSLVNYRSYYVPDMSYDAFVWRKNKWVLEEDVIGNNNEEDPKKQIIYVQNKKTGKLEAKEVKIKWNDPSDPNAPAGGSNHVAVTPEDTMEVDESRLSKSELRKKRRKEKKDKKKSNLLDRNNKRSILHD